MRSRSLLGTLLVTSTLGLSLAGCRLDDRPLAAADTAWPATLAAAAPGPVQDFSGPPPQRIPVGRLASYDDGWAWADRSYALDRAFYETPPDYGFRYDDDEPWVWQTSDRWAMYGDPYANDAWRYYYYQPGAVRPYFIRDDRYGYGYDDAGRLVAMFDLLGRLLPQADLYRYEDPASRYYQRAYLIRQTSLRAQPIVISREVWIRQAPVIERASNVWISAAQQQPQWVQYRQRTGDKFVRAFDDERRRRAPTISAAQAAPDQRRGFFSRPVSEPQPQISGTAPDGRGLLARPPGPDRSAERSAQKPDRGPIAAPPAERADIREGKGRKDEAQPAAAPDRREAKARDEQRQAQDQGRKQKQAEQLQQQGQQKQAEAHARQQQDQQREAVAQAQKQQHDHKQQADAQAQKQEHDQKQQADAQAQKQQRDQQRQAEAQARQQQQVQKQQAEAQARQQQQVEENARKQQAQQQAQKQAQDNAQKQQAQQQQAQKAQADKQQGQKPQADKQQGQKPQADKQKGQKQEAQTADPASPDQGKGGGKGHKG